MPSGLEFDWDDANRGHPAEHSIDPHEDEEVVRNEPIDLERQNRDGEDRLLQIGETSKGRILLVVSTFLGSRIRAMTAWDAKERMTRYWTSLRRSK